MQYQAVVFDFDLTLADASPAIFACSNHALTQMGFAPVDNELIFSTIGKHLADMFTVFTGNTDEALRQDFVRIYREHAEKIMDDMTTLLPGAKELLTWLNSQGIKCAIVSTKIRSRILETLRRNQMLELIHILVGCEDVSIPKPDPQGLAFACQHMGTAKENVLYVGDNEIDALTAKNYGVDFAAMLSGPTGQQVFLQHPHRWICKDLPTLHRLLQQL